MIEHHHYDGHEVAIELRHVGPARVRWIWRIDGVHCSKSRGTHASEAIARSEALLYAQIMVARLVRLGHGVAPEMAE